MSKNQRYVFLVIIALVLTACNNDKVPKEITHITQQSTTELTPNNLNNNYYEIIITTLVDIERPKVRRVKGVTLPANESDFCQKVLLLDELPNNSNLTACSFDGHLGQASFIFKKNNMNIEYDVTYEFKQI